LIRPRWTAFANTFDAAIRGFSLASGAVMRFCWAMKTPFLPTGVLASLMISASGIQWASAQLPSLNEQPWLGYFTAFESKKYHFGVMSVGKAMLTPMGDKGTAVSHALAIPIQIGIEEVLPDGKVTMKEIKPETLSSAEAASDKLVKTVIKGKVTGDAAFEATIEQDRGVISLGGRVVDPGTLKNPLRFAIRVRFPEAYKYNNPKDKKEEKAFEKKIEDDRIDMKWTDGKRKKQELNVAMEAASKDLNGPGIAAAEIEISAYKGKKFLFIASENSAMTLWNSKVAPLHEGFTINWRPDPEKDKEGKARLSFEVK
jgi:hypothetical protein